MTGRNYLPLILLFSALFFPLHNLLAQQSASHAQHHQSATAKPTAGGGCGMYCQMGGQEQMRGQAKMPGQGQMDERRSDMARIHTLLDNHEKIRRTFKDLPNGIESLTESDDPALVPVLRQHVADMERRLKEGSPIHQVDPLFREIFANASRIEMKIETTTKGVRVIETSTDARVANLIREHARKVNGFVKEGYSAVMGTMGGRGCRRN